jgi:hypothetical protein
MTPIDLRVIAALDERAIRLTLEHTGPLGRAISTVFPVASLEACLCLATFLVGEFRDHGHSPEGLHALIDKLWNDQLVLKRHPLPLDTEAIDVPCTDAS